MKRIAYKILESASGLVRVQITEQTHRCNQFGTGGDRYFQDKTGFTIGSSVHPSSNGTNADCYVRGENSAFDDAIFTMKPDVFARFAAAVAEYNETFKDGPDDIKIDPAFIAALQRVSAASIDLIARLKKEQP